MAVAVALSFGALDSGTAVAAVGRDLGDAPASYDVGARGAASARAIGPRLGAKVSADVAKSGVSRRSSSVTADSSDDAVPRFATWVAHRRATQSVVLAVSHIDAPAQLCGWVDFDLSHAFDRTERSCTTVPAGAQRAWLAWTARPGGAGQSVARLRIGLKSEQIEQPTGASDSGEVEDYSVGFVAAATPAITLVKTVSPTTVIKAGQVLTYRLVAKNTGDVGLSTVKISDELPGLSALSCDAPDSTILLPGRSLTCTATRRVTQDDLDFGAIANIAEVSAEAPGGDPNDDTDDVTAIDDANVNATQRAALALRAGWSVTKTRRGKRITLTLAARNTGNVTVTGTKVSGSLKKLSKLNCTATQGISLAPGASITCSGRYTISKADAKRGKLKATGTVRADRPYGDPSRTTDDLVVKASKTVKVAKSGSIAGSGASGGSGRFGSSGSEPGSGSAGLASTGGLSPWWFGIGAGLVGAGVAAIWRGRRRVRR